MIDTDFIIDDVEVKSPCIGYCILKDNTCAGCLRTIDEIKKWKQMSNFDKGKTISEIEKRKKLGKKYG